MDKTKCRKKLRIVLDPNYKEKNGKDYDYENLQRIEITDTGDFGFSE